MSIVLVVDDDPAVLRLVTHALQAAGISAAPAATAEDAVRLAESDDGELRLVIANHRLGDVVGRDVIEKVKEVRPNIRVLQYSGYSEAQLRAEGSFAPGASYLQKPFSLGELLGKVRELLGTGAKRTRRTH